MKNILVLMLCLWAAGLQAKDGFYIEPVVGIGRGNMRYDDHVQGRDLKYATVHSEALMGGYEWKRWQISAGVGYMRTGTRQTWAYQPLNNGVTASGYVTNYYAHIIVPVTVGYKVVKTEKSCVIGSIGSELAYNHSAITVTESGDRKSITVVKRSDFRKYMHAMGATAMANISYERQVGKHLALVTGVKVNYMVTNMPKEAYHVDMHGYTALLNCGLKIGL